MNFSSHASLCVLVVGAGNIGLPLVDLLARDPLVRQLGVVDIDRYSETNVLAQSILRADVGKAKAFAAARRARKVSGGRLDARGYHRDLVDVSWGVYRDCDVIIAALDSRRSRADLAMICWRMGRPLIDTGVNADWSLARTTLYLPGSDAPCYLCGIDDEGTLEAKYNCFGEPVTAAPTGAPAHLGTAAASLAIDELHRLARGESENAAGREVVLDLAQREMTTTRQRRNTSCGFDHQTWTVDGSISGRLTLGRALGLGGDDGGNDLSALRIEGSPFVQKLSCRQPGCGKHSRSILMLRRRLGSPPACRYCGSPLEASALDLTDSLPSSLPACDLRRTLSSLGLTTGDVVTISRRGKDLHFRMGGKNA